ncbi:MAG: diguanylate cyclase [Candidatus Competibacteraceae bacterium]|nr:diguanylate cyclase [Candidatus Competibacteraceae bacterium]
MKTPNMIRFLERSGQVFALACVWHGASAMVAGGGTADMLGLSPNPEPWVVSATALAVIGSIAASHLGLRGWRKRQKAIRGEPAPLTGMPRMDADGQDRLIEDLQRQVLELNEEKERLRRILQEKNATLLRDPLTGVGNRLAYQERLQQEFQRWRRFGAPLSFLVWDIDHFKRINDEHGHAVGDAVLRCIAQQLASRLRSTDFVARYGGEEFVTLLPGADLQAAWQVADEIRSRIAQAGFEHAGVRLPITISCGVAGFAPGDSPQTVFQRADQALYRAKQVGRNQCVVS